MHLKLAFSFSSSDLFKVSAVSTSRRHEPHPTVTLYKDESVFLELMKQAEIDFETHARLINAIAAARTAPDSTACCIEVQLTLEQVDLLRLESVLSQTA